MKNTTKAKNRAEQISATKKTINKWLAKNSDLGEKLANKNIVRLQELNNETKEGLFIVVGDSYSVKDELKEAGFLFCGGSQVWFSEVNIDINIDGIEVIEG